LKLSGTRVKHNWTNRDFNVRRVVAPNFRRFFPTEIRQSAHWKVRGLLFYFLTTQTYRSGNLIDKRVSLGYLGVSRIVLGRPWPNAQTIHSIDIVLDLCNVIVILV